MTWVVTVHRSALIGLYRVPRGEAAYISEALRALQVNPYRPDAIELGEGIYRITIRGHVIEYSIEVDRGVKVLNIQ